MYHSCTTLKSNETISFFQLVTTYYPGKSQYCTALKVYNQPKNRSPDFLACDSSRVYLEPSGEMEGEDYINASWIMGEFGQINQPKLFLCPDKSCKVPSHHS